MASIITVTALYDDNMNFFPGGKIFAIASDSLIMPSKNLPIAVHIPGTTDNVNLYPLLCVKTIEQGELCLNMTLDEYNALIRAASLSPNAEVTLTYDISADKPAGDTLTDTALYGFHVNSIAVGSDTGMSPVSITIIPFTQDSTALTGTLDFTAIAGLSDPSTVEITGYYI